MFCTVPSFPPGVRDVRTKLPGFAVTFKKNLKGLELVKECCSKLFSTFCKSTSNASRSVFKLCISLCLLCFYAQPIGA